MIDDCLERLPKPESYLCAACLLDSGANVLQASLENVAGFGICRSQSSGQLHSLGNHVRGVTAADLADGDDGGAAGINRAGQELVQCADEVCGGRNWIDRVMRPGGMSAVTIDLDFDFVAIGC